MLRPIAATLALLLLTAPSFGATERDWDDCRQQGDNDRRMQGCTRVLADSRTNRTDRAIAFNNRAIAWRNRGDLDHALADYTEAIKADPRYALAYANRGVALLDKREPDRSMEDCDRSIDLAPRAAYGYNCRGLAWRMKGDLDRAMTDCARSVELGPRYPPAYNCRGLVHGSKGEHERAIADFTEAIKIAPRYTFAFNNRGRAHAAMGEFDRAIADYDEALKINPRFRTAFRNRGLAWDSKGDNTRASADFAEAQRLASRGSGEHSPASPTQQAAPAAPSQAAAPPAGRTAPLAPASTPGPIGRRVALVIGNSAYRAVSALPNPERDANAVAAALRSLGFATVLAKNNANRAELVTTLKTFQDQVEKSDWAVIYYAGHGIEINGVNYLVPIDARLRDDRDVQDEAVALERVLMSVENARKLRLVILDACRDNPFVAQMKKSASTRSITRGLGNIEPEGGVMVAYAAKHGQLALDGDGQNSPFATALLSRLPTPNLEISLLFRMVRDDVLNATGKRQEPFVYGSLPGESLYFVQR